MSELVEALRGRDVGIPAQGPEYKSFASRERPPPVSPLVLARLIAALERESEPERAYAGFEIPWDTPPLKRGRFSAPARPVAMAADGTQGRTVYAQDGLRSLGPEVNAILTKIEEATKEATERKREDFENMQRLEARAQANADAAQRTVERSQRAQAGSDILRLQDEWARRMGGADIPGVTSGGVPVAVSGSPQVDSRSNEYYPTPIYDQPEQYKEQAGLPGGSLEQIAAALRQPARRSQGFLPQYEGRGGMEEYPVGYRVPPQSADDLAAAENLQSSGFRLGREAALKELVATLDPTGKGAAPWVSKEQAGLPQTGLSRNDIESLRMGAARRPIKNIPVVVPSAAKQGGALSANAARMKQMLMAAGQQEPPAIAAGRLNEYYPTPIYRLLGDPRTGQRDTRRVDTGPEHGPWSEFEETDPFSAGIGSVSRRKVAPEPGANVRELVNAVRIPMNLVERPSIADAGVRYKFPPALSPQKVPRLLGVSNVGRRGAPTQVGGLAGSGIMEGGSAQRFLSGEEGRVEEAPVADVNAAEVAWFAGISLEEFDVLSPRVQAKLHKALKLHGVDTQWARDQAEEDRKAALIDAETQARVSQAGPYRRGWDYFTKTSPEMETRRARDRELAQRAALLEAARSEGAPRKETAKELADRVAALQAEPAAAAARRPDGTTGELSVESPGGWPPVVSAEEATSAALIKALPEQLPTAATAATVRTSDGTVVDSTTNSLRKELVSLERGIRADAPSERQETDNYLATLNKRSDQIRSDLRDGLKEFAKADAKDFKEYETRFKALDEYHKTGKLPERMRQDRITNLMLEMSKALLGNQNLYDAFKEGVAGFQTVDKAAREKYADDLAAMLTASKGMVDSKMAIRNARRQESIAMTRFAAEQNRGNATLAQENLKIVEQARQNVRANEISLLRNRIQIRQAEIALAAVRKRTEAERVMDQVVGPLYQQARAEAQAGDRARLDKYFFINAEGQPVPRLMEIYGVIKSSGGGSASSVLAALGYQMRRDSTAQDIASDAQRASDALMGSWTNPVWEDVAKFAQSKGVHKGGEPPTSKNFHPGAKMKKNKAWWRRQAVAMYEAMDKRNPGGAYDPDPVKLEGTLPNK